MYGLLRWLAMLYVERVITASHPPLLPASPMPVKNEATSSRKSRPVPLISRSAFIPELYFSSDSGSSDETFLSPMSSPASTSSSFSEPNSPTSGSNCDGYHFTLSTPEETYIHVPHTPRRLHKRPPLQRLNIKSIPFPTSSPSGSPLLGIWRTDMSPESPLPPPGPSSRGVKFASPVYRHPTSHRHLPRSPHPSHLKEHTDAVLSLVLAGDLPLSRTRTLSGNLDAPQSALDETESSDRDPHASPAFLACQEFITAETDYLSALQAAQTTTSLFSLLSLIDASQHLLSRLKEDPSLERIAEAFVSSEIRLTTAFISWFEDVAPSNNENVSIRPSRRGRGDTFSSGSAAGSLKPSRSISGPRGEKSLKGLRWRSRSTTDLRRAGFHEQTKNISPRQLPAQRVKAYCAFFGDVSSIWVSESTSRALTRALTVARALNQKVECIAFRQTPLSA